MSTQNVKVYAEMTSLRDHPICLVIRIVKENLIR